MTQWQYATRVYKVDKEDETVIHHLQRHYPGQSWKDLPQFDILALEAQLNAMGEEGWELVSVESAETLGKNGDLGQTYAGITIWRRVYLCVFKRPVGA